MSKMKFVPSLLLSLLFRSCWGISNGSCAENVKLVPEDYPSKVKLRLAVIHQPPFATVTRLDNDTYTYQGFQIDLLSRLQIFAERDGISLELELSAAPQTYAGSFDLIANDCNTTANPNPLEDCQKYDIIIGKSG